MANTTLSPNMGLIVPTVGVDPGPDWANNVNADLSILDGHNHSPGSGVPVNPSGIDINADLPFGNNNATVLRSVRFNAQAAPIAAATDLGCVYESGVDLYYNDGNGNQIRITQSGSLAGAAGTITGLPSGTASASFGGGTFVFQSATSVAATMDVGPVIFRNTTASSNGITISAPTPLASSYSLTLPSAQAVANNAFVTTDTSGNLSNIITVDGSTITITGNKLVAATQLVAATENEVNSGTNTTAFVNPLTLANKTRAAIFNVAGTYTWTAPAGVYTIMLYGRGGAGGGGSGAANTGGATACGGAGGGGAVSQAYAAAVVPGTQYTVVVGAGGAGGANVNSGPGNAGANGVASSFAGAVRFNNIGGGGGAGIASGSATGGTTVFGAFAGTGGSSTSGGAGGAVGNDSIHQSGGTAGGTASAGAASGGGGGGAGDSGGAAGASAGSPGAAGGDGTGGGGGGGSSSVAGNISGRGGNGSPGQIIVVYTDVYIANTNT